MKKLVIMVTIMVSVGLIASQGLACWWGGYRGDPARGSMMGTWDGYGPGVNDSGAYRNFLNDTTNLRQELAAKRGEYNALMVQSNPDVNKASQLSKEIVRLHDQLQAKAQGAGLQRPGNYGPGYGHRCDGWACW
ncbi:MAG: periplasmic heavy metal sensor [Deltaproteobacteria bacterium]|nr:periplasmic heavy metal sensor [Deltaproteobacteria bacterium]MBW2321707.1 periplasmic heavy metal sensor [Deltaproteobacteria bacterium]RKX57576.1 MAG: hypothetical protein DRP28_06530 [Thermodesulfobacteriota bacterium]